MCNTQEESRRSTSKSGVMPRPVFEPETRRDPPSPTTSPESPEQHDSTTDVIPYIAEGHDSTAVGDVDRVEYDE